MSEFLILKMSDDITVIVVIFKTDIMCWHFHMARKWRALLWLFCARYRMIRIACVKQLREEKENQPFYIVWLWRRKVIIKSFIYFTQLNFNKSSSLFNCLYDNEEVAFSLALIQLINETRVVCIIILQPHKWKVQHPFEQIEFSGTRPLLKMIHSLMSMQLRIHSIRVPGNQRPPKIVIYSHENRERGRSWKKEDPELGRMCQLTHLSIFPSCVRLVRDALIILNKRVGK